MKRKKLNLIYILVISCFFAVNLFSGDSKVQTKRESRPRLLPVKKDGKYGYIDCTGKLKIPCKFKYASVFSEGLASFMGDGITFGYINTKGEIVIPAKYEKAHPFKDGRAFVVFRGKQTCIDTKGKTVPMPEKSDEKGMVKASVVIGADGKPGKMKIIPGTRFSEGMINIKSGGKWGFADEHRRVVIKPVYDNVWPFFNGSSRIQLDGKWGFIDKSGKYIAEPEYDEVFPFYDGFAAVRVNDKWGFIDGHGKMVIKPQFDMACRFKEGLSSVKSGGKYGYIDTSGKIVISPQWDYAQDFQDGIAMVMRGNKQGYIDKTGRYIWRPSE